MMTCKACNEDLVEDEYHFLYTCLAYIVIHETLGAILRGSYNLVAILKAPPRRLSSYVYAPFTQTLFAPKHERHFSGRKQISRNFVYLGSMSQDWPICAN